jgi:hypothetical protein
MERGEKFDLRESDSGSDSTIDEGEGEAGGNEQEMREIEARGYEGES